METTDRLRRLIDDELGECCAADLDERRAELAAIRETVDRRADERDVSALSALANDTRYRIVRTLAAADRDLCVCELAPLSPVSESATSHALSALADAGLVARRKEGRWRYYGVTERGRALLTALDETRGA